MSTTNASRWSEYWTQVGNEDWLAARRLLDLSPRVSGFYGCYLTEELVPSHIEDDGGHLRTRKRPNLQLDWQAAASRVDADGFSSTERRLARLVAALATGHPVDLQDLSQLGSWSLDVWAILTEWATDGAATVHPAHHTGGDEPICCGDNASQAGRR